MVYEEFCTKEGAERLRLRLEEHWGGKAQFWLVHYTTGIYAVRSNLLRGLPGGEVRLFVDNDRKATFGKFNCAHCGKEVPKAYVNQRFCGISCGNKFRKGVPRGPYRRAGKDNLARASEGKSPDRGLRRNGQDGDAKDVSGKD